MKQRYMFYPSKNLDDQNLADDLSSILALSAQWRKKWFVILNALKTKLLIFHNRQRDTEFAPITMNGRSHREAYCLERLLGLKFGPNLK